MASLPIVDLHRRPSSPRPRPQRLSPSPARRAAAAASSLHQRAPQASGPGDRGCRCINTAQPVLLRVLVQPRRPSKYRIIRLASGPAGAESSDESARGGLVYCAQSRRITSQWVPHQASEPARGPLLHIRVTTAFALAIGGSLSPAAASRSRGPVPGLHRRRTQYGRPHAFCGDASI
ncbi:hypothetical protein T440DRAFT_463190 [Plenodomus tracheiphilus IPT5]|uniref:Uncharacterized protein n=1 Tax=Plenodomus tracheiphilus IPT5 TaxID=1408161 RepID=A0A6A7BP48_9PLEO|nr:hypothetical protein T440DRAFT_463190 [Plenodomus tracheiphilus IPT5]